jgi:hypothetical protein
MLRTILIIGAATIMTAACTATPGAGSTGSPEPSLTPEPSLASENPSSGPPAGSGSALPTAVTDPIVADAAARLGVDPSQVNIVDAHEETWPDGSLGCPKPGMMYTQALVDGYQVIVEANGTRLDYRGSAPGKFVLCETP